MTAFIELSVGKSTEQEIGKWKFHVNRREFYRKSLIASVRQEEDYTFITFTDHHMMAVCVGEKAEKIIGELK